MIYDCFPFFNELDILELRLNILYDYVDYFVIAEGNKTHTGAYKEFIFESNKARFEKFLDKIKYIKVDDFPSLEESKESEDGNKWLYENYQRDAIMRGLGGCSDNDIIMISDCDEIINPKVIKKYKKGIASPLQLRFKFNYNTLCSNAPYSKSAKIARYCDLVDPKQKVKQRQEKFCKYSKYGLPTYLRFLKGKKIKNGGWHFGYIGDFNFIKQKMNAIVEQQHNPLKFMNEEEIKLGIENGCDILKTGETFVNLKIDGLFPKYFLDNLSKYKNNISDKKQISFLWVKMRYFTKKFLGV